MAITADDLLADLIACLEKGLKSDEGATLADAGLSIARALRALGTGNAATEVGGLELLAKEVREGCREIAGGLTAVADALEKLAYAPAMLK